MIELEFLGRSGDTRSVIFTDEDGERYSAVITDELRTALRRSPAVVDVREKAAPAKATLRPAQIQALLREGLSAEEISNQQGVPVESVTRFESPILAEKAWAVARAQQAPITVESGSPTLEDLVINRLAARGADHRSLTWEALRRPGEDWEITLTFVQSAVERSATWTLAESSNQVTAIDQEAHWLTETASPITPVAAFPPPAPRPIREEEQVGVEALLDQANSLRGRRQPLLDDVQDGQAPPPTLGAGAPPSVPFFAGRTLPFDKPPADSPASPAPPSGPIDLKATKKKDEPREQEEPEAQPPTSADDPDVAPGSLFPEEASSALPSAAETPSKKRGSRRRSVPSWDEIVFGAKSE